MRCGVQRIGSGKMGMRSALLNGHGFQPRHKPLRLSFLTTLILSFRAEFDHALADDRTQSRNLLLVFGRASVTAGFSTPQDCPRADNPATLEMTYTTLDGRGRPSLHITK